MVMKLQQGVLSFKIERTSEPLIARAGLVLPYEMAGALEFLKFCQRKMPEGKRIGYYRSDSAAYQVKVIDHCFQDKVLFTITMLLNR